jgi:hypothetical protein
MPRTSFLFNAESRFATNTASYAATYAPDAYNAGTHVMVLAGNVTLNAPVNGNDGQRIAIRFVQDGTGSRTLTVGTGIHTCTGVSATLSTAANAIDILELAYIASTGLWHIIAAYKY